MRFLGNGKNEMTATADTHDVRCPGRGGRPPLPPDQKLVRTRGVRLTQAEDDNIVNQASAAGLTVSDYLRRRAIGGPIPKQRFNPALVSEINQAGLQLKAIGNLANQLALATHTDRRFAHDWKMVRDSVQKAIGEVESALAKVTEGD